LVQFRRNFAYASYTPWLQTSPWKTEIVNILKFFVLSNHPLENFSEILLEIDNLFEQPSRHQIPEPADMQHGNEPSYPNLHSENVVYVLIKEFQMFPLPKTPDYRLN
jgi:hypothetical protein